MSDNNSSELENASNSESESIVTVGSGKELVTNTKKRSCTTTRQTEIDAMPAEDARAALEQDLGPLLY